MGRSDVASDEVGRLLQAAGGGDFDAFAVFYERTSSVVFRLLQHALGESAAAERVTVRVYARVWQTAPTFDAATTSGDAFLIRVVYRELGGRGRRGEVRCAHDRAEPIGRRDRSFTPWRQY